MLRQQSTWKSSVDILALSRDTAFVRLITFREAAFVLTRSGSSNPLNGAIHMRRKLSYPAVMEKSFNWQMYSYLEMWVMTFRAIARTITACRCWTDSGYWGD